MIDWQPIETAPKDGTHFLSTSKHLDGEIFICIWLDRTMTHSYGRERHNGWWVVGVPKRYYVGWGPFYSPIKQDDLMPTHWMPLPPPPKKENE